MRIDTFLSAGELCLELRKNGLKEEEITFSDNSILKIIRNYTREAGVRNLDREVNKVCRKKVKDLSLGGKATKLIDNRVVRNILGPEKFKYGQHDDQNSLGQVNGLAWTSVGGELLQIEKARKLDITEEVYYNIIRQKTATLLAACCAMGAQTVQDNVDLVEKMRLFGEYIGMAFQIKDDLFDYGETAIGKPTGIDIKEQKMTLPLIHTLNTVSTPEKNWLIQSVKHHNRDKKRVKEVIKRVKAAGGLSYAEKKMEEYRQKALSILLEFPKDNYRDALELMVNYVISRKQ